MYKCIYIYIYIYTHIYIHIYAYTHTYIYRPILSRLRFGEFHRLPHFLHGGADAVGEVGRLSVVCHHLKGDNSLHDYYYYHYYYYYYYYYY